MLIQDKCELFSSFLIKLLWAICCQYFSNIKLIVQPVSCCCCCFYCCCCCCCCVCCCWRGGNMSKKYLIRNKKCLHWKLLTIEKKVIHGLIGPSLAYIVVFYCLLWSWMVFHGIVWPFCGLLWQNIDLIGLESSFLGL